MTDHWYSFGVCPCDAHTIIEIRSASEQPNVNPFHHYPPCPSCGNPLPLRGYWPAPDDGFGGSSGGLDEILGRVRRVVEKHPEDRACVDLGVALDAWEAKHAPPPTARETRAASRMLSEEELDALLRKKHEIQAYRTLGPPLRVEHSVPVESWEVRSREAVRRLNVALDRTEYEEAVRWAVMHPSRKAVAVKMIPPEGISPFKEWRVERPYRDRVPWYNGVWEAAPQDDETVVVLLWPRFAVPSYMGVK